MSKDLVSPESTSLSLSHSDVSSSAAMPPLSENFNPYPHSSPSLPPAATPMLRRSSRLTKPPIWMKDYVVQSKGSSCLILSQCVTYDYLSPSYRASFTAYSAIVEPKSYAESKTDPKWIEAMKAEISALEANQTWSIADLPQGK
ncbi:uncharacterized protein [Nicotiana tomentosiformis]|uniref:uncharacterized protein n=1 Tax=Nicotiana tomentosiformis TaxID=4098 RepID=UPI00388C7231